MTCSRSPQKRNAGATAARIVLALVLGAAALPKLRRPAAFHTALAAWQLLPDPLSFLTAMILPWLEVLVGVALLAVRPLRRGALLWGGALPILFAGGLLINRLRGIEAPCGCFSTDPASAPAGWGHIVLNLALMVLALAAAKGGPDGDRDGDAILSKRRFPAPQWSG